MSPDHFRPRDSRLWKVSAAPARASAGFTLVEVMIAAGISAFVLVAVLTSFLMMGRSGANLYNYGLMEEQSRRGLDRFSQDVRMATGITWTDSTRVTLIVPHLTGIAQDTVVYYWDTTGTQTSNPTYHCFLRSGPDPIAYPITGALTGPAVTTTLITNVQTFEFDRWMIGSTGPATNDAGTKQLQIRLTIQMTRATVASASNLVVSARYILRNKA